MDHGQEKDSIRNLLFSDGGTARRQPRICPQCGTWNPPDAEFCGKDGMKLPEQGRRVRTPLSSQPHSPPSKGVTCTAGPETTSHGIATPRAIDTQLSMKDRTDRMDRTDPTETARGPSKDADDYTAPQGKAIYPQTPKDHLLLITVCILLIAVASGGFYWYLFVKERAAMQQNLEMRATLDREIDAPPSPPDRLQQTAPSASQRAGPPDVSPTAETQDTMGPGKAIDSGMKSERAPAVLRKASRGGERKASEAVRDEAIKKRAFAAAPAHGQPKDASDDLRVRPKEEPPDRAKIERDINRLLRDSGVDGITAEVDENMVATFKGTVRRGEDRRKALSAAKGFKDVKVVKDVIFVIRP